MKFKEISIANLVAAISSALITIVMVLVGYTYWAIAWQIVSITVVRTIMLWILGNWRPFHKPDFSIIKKIFSFSFFLLITGIINIFIKYIYNIKIPKVFSKEELGYYDRAKKFQDIPAMVVTSAVISVAYPILSNLNSDKQKQLAFFRKITRIISFLIFPIMMGLIGVIENLIIVVLTPKWLPMIPYFQILCIAAIFMPFQNLCLTTLNAIGSSKLNFTLELGRNIFTLTLFLLLSDTVKEMLWGFSFAMFTSYVINMIIVGRKLGYSIINHIKDITPYAIISIAMYLIILFINNINISITSSTILNIAFILCLQLLISIVFYAGITYLLGSKVIKDCMELMIVKNK